MNWLAHLFLSPSVFEDRLGNVIADLIKGQQRKNLNPRFNKGIQCHLLIDNFTDHHPVVKSSKRLMITQHRRYSGILVDIFYDHLLARNWNRYSKVSLSEFTTEIYDSFLHNFDEIPQTINPLIKRMIDEDWLGSYHEVLGIETTLTRIKRRLSIKHHRYFDVDKAMQQLEDDYSSFNDDFNVFFPQMIEHLEQNLV